MQPSLLKLLAPAVLGLGLAATASAQAVINVSSNISTSTTWTSNNVYRLTQQIFVLPGATLTIEAGTLVASTSGLGGSLAVTRGAQIIAKGTKDEPIIFTSTADTATWAGGEFGPREDGVWREAANEWGNITIMGEGFISENAPNVRGPGMDNVPSFDPANVAVMEGLVEAFAGDPNVRYGGGNDDDDSGCLEYVSLRYGGNVIGLNNELNGLSLGGIGRETDINNIEIMNNVDDGIELWGGTVNIRKCSIWNIGDDSFDVDQGYRGSVQYCLIVQGYSLNDSQGSGVGDNAFEHDGGEDSFWQPTTEFTVYNATVIGQPDGDGMTAWRDNARVQYRNCLFIEGGETLVRPDGDDGDGASGYGAGGTLGFAAHWSTPAGPGNPTRAAGYPGNGSIVGTTLAQAYQTHVDGFLCEIRNSCIFDVADLNDATALGVFQPQFNNTIETSLPIANITRAAPVVRGGRVQERVTFLDPRPVGAAEGGAFLATNPVFERVDVRGAFKEGNNWLAGWTASEQFGFTPREDIWGIHPSGCDIGANGLPVLAGSGATMSGGVLSLDLHNAPANAFASILLNGAQLTNNLLGLKLEVDLTTSASVVIVADAFGRATLPLPLPPLAMNTELFFQSLIIDPTLAVGPFLLPANTSTAVKVLING